MGTTRKVSLELRRNLALYADDVASSDDVDDLTAQLVSQFDLVPTWRGTIDVLAAVRSFGTTKTPAIDFVKEGTRSLFLFDWLEQPDVRTLLELLRAIDARHEPVAPATVSELRLPVLLAVASLRRLTYLLDLDSATATAELLGP